MIVGTVIDIRQVPVAYAKVQLRNLDHRHRGAGRRIERESANIEFAVDDPGTYVVEMVTGRRLRRSR